MSGSAESALATYLEIVDEVAPGLVEGLYVVGSFALDDWIEDVSDINIVAVTAEPATDEDFRTLLTAHAVLAEAQPKPEINGAYLAWGDLVIEPATGLHRPWVLANQLHHDGDCFEINPVTWFALAKHGRTARGPAPSRIEIPIDTEARVRWVVDNVQTYWSDVAQQVEQACADDGSAAFETGALVWCTLGSLRQHYTAFSGDITSKRGAGEHGLREAPTALHPVIRAAMDRRAAGNVGEVSAVQMLQATAVIRWCVQEIAGAV